MPFLTPSRNPTLTPITVMLIRTGMQGQGQGPSLQGPAGQGQ